MKITRLLCALVLLSFGICSAQTFYPRTDPFTFDATQAINSWDGSDPANPPYPNQMGSVQLGTPNYVPPTGPAGISIPFQLGYLNNGFLEPCNPMAWGPQVWQPRPDGTIADGSQEGDISIFSGSTSCPYFTCEYGTSGNSCNISDGFSANATYSRHFFTSCGRYGCHRNHRDILQGGNGVATQNKIDPNGP